MKKESVPKAKDLLELSYELAKIHLDSLRDKSQSDEGLSPHEGNAVCTYLKTFSQITKYENELEKSRKGEVASMTDEEIKAELERLMRGGSDDSSKD